MSESGSAAVASLPTGMDPSIHSDVFTRYERGVLEIEHRIDDIRNFTHPTQGMKLRQLRMITLNVHRRVNDARSTVLNRMLFAAYSSANALLAAGIGDFDSTANSSVASPSVDPRKPGDAYHMPQNFASSSAESPAASCRRSWRRWYSSPGCSSSV